ncbi:MAG TPA: type II toxin-antitoxin system RelE/ParE family toxin [Acetobacteraceae bacterium]|nr:type II toxin-antitoxin system RelE/ParE family toxin [Acetobacteraceae bacterium]
MSRSVRPYSLSPLAEIYLEEIWLYTFKHWSPRQADRYHNQIIATIEELAAGVKAGRPATVREGYFKYRSDRISCSIASRTPILMLFASCTGAWT